ncbi:MAG: peroxiredoxin [Gammaproteobacteria bacterium]|nr:peroxiredoxin [Gammaproteobacteria bacterium]
MTEHDLANSDSPQRALLIGRPVPSFQARSTHGDISLEDYRGKWLVMFSHPADFTPVCTSEFIAFQRSIHEFENRNCALLGLSVDSIYSHVAWVKNIQEKFNVEISFPIVEDISMAVSFAYGMLDASSQSTATVRAVFFIDPCSILRAKIIYPMQVGRSISEIIRTLSALQAADETGMSAAEGWQPNEPLTPLAPTTVSQANSVTTSSEHAEWYYTERKVIPPNENKPSTRKH